MTSRGGLVVTHTQRLRAPAVDAEGVAVVVAGTRHASAGAATALEVRSAVGSAIAADRLTVAVRSATLAIGATLVLTPGPWVGTDGARLPRREAGHHVPHVVDVAAVGALFWVTTRIVGPRRIGGGIGIGIRCVAPSDPVLRPGRARISGFPSVGHPIRKPWGAAHCASVGFGRSGRRHLGEVTVRFGVVRLIRFSHHHWVPTGGVRRATPSRKTNHGQAKEQAEQTGGLAHHGDDGTTRSASQATRALAREEPYSLRIQTRPRKAVTAATFSPPGVVCGWTLPHAAGVAREGSPAAPVHIDARSTLTYAFEAGARSTRTCLPGSPGTHQRSNSSPGGHAAADSSRDHSRPAGESRRRRRDGIPLWNGHFGEEQPAPVQTGQGAVARSAVTHASRPR